MILSPLIFAGKLYNGGSVSGSIPVTDNGAGQFSVTETVTTSGTVSGTYTAQDTASLKIYSSVDSTKFCSVSTFTRVNNGNFTFPAGTGDITTSPNLKLGANLFCNSGSPAGRYSGIENILITTSGPGFTHSTILALPITFNLIPANSIATDRDMVFPPQTLDSGNVSITLNPNTTTLGAASFSATGAKNTSATLSVASPVYLKRASDPAGTPNTVRVDTFTFGGNRTSGSGVVSFPNNLTGLTSTVNGILVGATAFYQSTLPGGVYTGTTMITISY